MPLNLFTLFNEPSVALLYFMSLIVLSCAALFMALAQRSRGKGEFAAGRYAIASGGITLAWLVLIIGAVSVLISNQPAGAIMPPLDRAANALVIVFAAWAFLVPERGKPHSGYTLPTLERTDDNEGLRSPQALIHLMIGIYVVAICVGYVITTLQWQTMYVPDANFSTSKLGIIWSAISGILAVGAILLLLVNVRSVEDVPLKVVFFAILAAAYGYSFASANGAITANDSGVLRLAFFVAMPLLPVVVYRMVVDRLSAFAQEKAAQATVSTLTNISNNLLDTSTERESMTLLKALGMMLERDKPEELPRQIASAVANNLKADVIALLVVDDPEYADVVAAYDSVQQRPIAAMALKLDEQPTLQVAMSTRTQKTLNADSNLNELVDLYTRLDIQKIGPVYIQPLTREGELVGALIVALPYTQRDLRESERRLLESMGPMAARMLAISRSSQRAVIAAQNRPMQELVEGQPAPSDVPMSAVRAEMQSNLELARTQINELSAMVRELQIELDFERSRLAELASTDPEGMSITQRMERMQDERKQLEAERERLIQALQEAQTQLATASGTDEAVYEAAIQIIQKERDELQMQKEELEAQLLDLRSKTESQAPAAVRSMLDQLTQDQARFAVERDQLKSQLDEVNAQLASMGIEGGAASLVSTVVQLTEERTRYKELAEKSTRERNLLLAEIQKVRDRIQGEVNREQRIQALENELVRIAQDREVVTRQRDALRQEREATQGDKSMSEAQRTQLATDLTKLKNELSEMTFERNRAIAERNKLTEERATLLTERDKLIAGRTALQTERDQLLARVEGNREILQKLGADGVDALKHMIDELTEERSGLEHQLVQARKQNQALRDRLDAVERSVGELKRAPNGDFNTETVAVMLSVAQELRSPLSAIGAYVDLLLGESVGILGDLQAQFLQRVKANSDRLATLVEDFIRVVAIDTGQLNLKPMQVDMAENIDDAITATRTQFREKGITLKLDVPEQMPTINGDKGALQQIVVELLSNAYRASPTDGEVEVMARWLKNYRFPGTAETAPVVDVIQLAIKDNGGGVPVEEQQRVFSRLYRAENPLIQGLGDTGVGLSIARALTELHGGRIWLESTPGESSTFYLAIPLQGLAMPESTDKSESDTTQKAEHVAS